MILPRIIARNILSNWTGFAIQAAITFFLTPFVLSHLGETRYGVWLLVTSVSGYYGLLDIGLRAGMTQFITRHYAKDNADLLNRTTSSGLAALCACGMAIGIFSLGIALVAPYVFDVDDSLKVEIRYCIVAMGISTAVQFACFPFSAIFTALQRYDLSNLLGVLPRLAVAVGTWWCLEQGYELIALANITAFGSVIGGLLHWHVARIVLPTLHVSWRLANWRTVKLFTSFGIWNSIIGVSAILLTYTDALIIGVFLPVAAVTPYMLAARLGEYYRQVPTLMGQVFYPAAVSLYAQRRHSDLVKLFLKGSKLQLLVCAALGSIMAVWAQDFFVLWVGREVALENEFAPVHVVFWILLAAMGATYTAGIGGQILLGKGHIHLLAAIAIVEAVTNVALSVILVPRFGLIGICSATLLAVVVARVIVSPVIVLHILKVSFVQYISESCIRPAIVGIALITCGALVKRALNILSWSELLLGGAITGVIGVLIVATIGFTREERDYFRASLRVAATHE